MRNEPETRNTTNGKRPRRSPGPLRSRDTGYSTVIAIFMPNVRCGVQLPL